MAALYDELENASLPANIKKKKAKRALRIIGNTLFFTVLCILLICIVGMQVVKENGEMPMLFGYSLNYVQTGSMEPTLPVGSIILSKKVENSAELKIGDVVTFYNATREKVTHRIVEVLEENGVVSYRTKGDNPLNSIDADVLIQENIISIMVRKLA